MYDLALLLYVLCALPKFLYDLLFFKKYRSSIKQRLGIGLKTFSDKTIWVHAVSVGEIRASRHLIAAIAKKKGNKKLIVSTTTETGRQEAQRLLPADEFIYLPLDFSFLIKRALKKINPEILIFIESDFWHNLLRLSKKSGCFTALVSAKISERSYGRFMLAPFFSKRLFADLDLILPQNETYKERFLNLRAEPDRVQVAGNLKYDNLESPLSLDEKRGYLQDLAIRPDDFVIAVGSTHFPEEEALIGVFKRIWQRHANVKILLAPRHPERFNSVAELLQKEGIDYYCLSSKTSQKREGRVVLIDKMGCLSACFQLSRMAIIGGSFFNKVGGHNILEPVFFNVPVIFGPYMFGQRDLEKIVLENGWGSQVGIEKLEEALIDFIQGNRLKIENTEAICGVMEKTLKFLPGFA